MKQEFTHKGWLGIAPIYLDETGENITERYWWSGFLLTFSTWVIQFINDVFDTEYPFPIRVTGKLKHPLIMEFDE